MNACNVICNVWLIMNSDWPCNFRHTITLLKVFYDRSLLRRSIYGFLLSTTSTMYDRYYTYDSQSASPRAAAVENFAVKNTEEFLSFKKTKTRDFCSFKQRQKIFSRMCSCRPCVYVLVYVSYRWICSIAAYIIIACMALCQIKSNQIISFII